jgi:hypothetical protein
MARFLSLYRLPVSLSVLLLACTLVFFPVQASTPEPQVPDGFYLVSQDDGVRLYRKEYAEGNPDYVQVVDLSQGAALRLMHGQRGEPRMGKGMYGGDDYRFSYQTLPQFWSQALARDEKTFCVFNGQFFYMPESPTRLALPLKVDGEIITTGFGYSQYDGEERMLELWPEKAEIRELSERALHASSAPDILAGLSEFANKRARYAVARTFVGVADGNRDGVSETVLVLNTLSATQAQAADVLRAWGAESVMMLDGGGSTQLYCRDGWKVQSERLIPQAIAVVGSSGPPYAAEFGRLPSWPVILAGKSANLEIEAHNRGSQPWEASRVELRIDTTPWRSAERLELLEDVPPGESVTFLWPANGFYRSSVYHLELQILRNGQELPGETARFSLIVLPTDLESRQMELQELASSWAAQSDGDVELQARAWLQEQAGQELLPEGTPFPATPLEFQAGDVIWVPVLMLPFVVVLLLLMSRARRAG